MAAKSLAAPPKEPTATERLVQEIASQFPEKPFLSTRETARALSLGQTKVREMVSAGSFRSMKVGAKTLIVRASVLEWVEAHLSDEVPESTFEAAS